MKITMFSTVGGMKVIENFQGLTWGELKRSLQEIYPDLNISNIIATIKSTRANLERDDAVLPKEDFTIFISPKKVDSGNTQFDLGKEIGTLRFILVANNLEYDMEDALESLDKLEKLFYSYLGNTPSNDCCNSKVESEEEKLAREFREMGLK